MQQQALHEMLPVLHVFEFLPQEVVKPVCLRPNYQKQKHWAGFTIGTQIKKFWRISLRQIFILTCNVVLSVSMGVIKILQSPADIDAAPVFAAIGISYG